MPSKEPEGRTGVGQFMDERKTLKILAWSVGSIVGLMFVLNAYALTAPS
jgi:hypothetical protein